MSIRQLEYFLKLSETEHLTSAAKALGISQPSLTAMIKSLEQDLGVPLFDRYGRNIRLNDAGKTYRDYVLKAFTELNNGFLALHELSGQNHGLTINIASTCPRFTCNLVHYCLDNSPNIIAQRFIDDADIPLFLQSNNCAYAISHSNQNFGKSIKSIPLCNEHLVLAVSLHNPLATLPYVDLTDLANEPFLSLAPESCLQKIVDSLLSKIGIKPKYVMQCDSSTRIEMVAKNHGICVTSTMCALGEYSLPEVKYIPIRWPNCSRFLSLYVATDKYYPANSVKFANKLIGEAKKLCTRLNAFYDNHFAFTLPN